MVTPLATPATMPVDEPMVAAPVALLDHEPPMTVPVNVMDEPAQTEDTPDIVPATGNALTVTIAFALQPVAAV
jgi:hypothetical protein